MIHLLKLNFFIKIFIYQKKQNQVEMDKKYYKYLEYNNKNNKEKI